MNIYDILEEILSSDNITVQRCKSLAKKGICILIERQKDFEKLQSEWDEERQEIEETHKHNVYVNIVKCAKDIIELSKEQGIIKKNN